MDTVDCHSDQGGAGDIEAGLVILCFSSPRGWVLTWLSKRVEKVIPQPVYGGGQAPSTAAGLEGLAQVLLGRGAGWDGGEGAGWADAPGCPLTPVCPGRQRRKSLGTAALGAQVRPGVRMAFQWWDSGEVGMGTAPWRGHRPELLI